MSKRKQSPSPAKSAAASAAPQEYRKPQADVYTVLLAVALLIVMIATAALWMTMKDDYNNDIKGGPPNPVWHQPATGTLLDASRGIA